MYRIIKNREIAKNVFELVVENELIASHFKPGQFVVVMPDETSEKIPLTIYKTEGSCVSMIYQVVGKTTYDLSKKNDYIFSILGPLGKPSIILNMEAKKVLFVAGGVGIAPVIPQAVELKKRGVICDLIYGMKTIDNCILKDDIDKYFDDVIIVTEDNTADHIGLVTDYVDDLCYDFIIAIGPVIMMKKVVELAEELKVPSIVSMNPIMIDGTGMCGACRLFYDGIIHYACIDGPEFIGAKVDFDSLIKRMDMYKTIEGRKYLEEIEGDTHHGGCGNCEQ